MLLRILLFLFISSHTLWAFYETFDTYATGTSAENINASEYSITTNVNNALKVTNAAAGTNRFLYNENQILLEVEFTFTYPQNFVSFEYELGTAGRLDVIAYDGATIVYEETFEAVRETVKITQNITSLVIKAPKQGWAMDNLQAKSSPPEITNVSTQGVFTPLGDAQFGSRPYNNLSFTIDKFNHPYVAYTDTSFNINVKSLSNDIWTDLGDYLPTGADKVSIAVDSTGAPYISYTDRASGGMNVKKYYQHANVWGHIGSSDFEISNSSSRIYIDKNDTLYCLMTKNLRMILMRYNGTSWQVVGSYESFELNTNHSSASLAFDTSNNPYIAYRDPARAIELVVKRFNNTWEEVTNLGLYSGGIGSVSMAFDASNVPYIVYTDATKEYKLTAKKFNGISWLPVGESGFSQKVWEMTDLHIDSLGQPVIAYQNFHEDNTNSYFDTVLRYENGTWNTVGGRYAYLDGGSYPNLVLDNEENPLLASAGFGDITVLSYLPITGFFIEENHATVGTVTATDPHNSSMIFTVEAGYDATFFSIDSVSGELRFNNAPDFESPMDANVDNIYEVKVRVTNAAGLFDEQLFKVYLQDIDEKPTITNPIDSAIFTSLSDTGIRGNIISYTYMALDQNGVPYILIVESSKLSVKKLLNGNWVTVGNAGFTPSSAFHATLAFDQTNTPYVAFGDFANAQKIAVMKLVGNQWITVGSNLSIGAASYMHLAFNEVGTPYVAYRDAGNSGKVSVKSFEGLEWHTVGNNALSYGNVTYFDFLVKENKPYVLFNDNYGDGKATLRTLEGQTWQTVGAYGFSTGVVRGLSLAITAQNKLYVTYADETLANSVIMTYDGSSWQQFGTTIETGAFSAPVIAIDSNQSVVILYKDKVANATRYERCRTSGVRDTLVLDTLLTSGSFRVMHLDKKDYPTFSFLDQDSNIVLKKYLAVSSFSMPEGELFSGVVTASDPYDNSINFTTDGGADETFFTIDEINGSLSFYLEPEVAYPQDENIDNFYEVKIEAYIGSDLSDTRLFLVEVLEDYDRDGTPDIEDDDDDNDSMPDAYELLYGLDPKDASDKLLDKDDDGVSNYDEYLGGTDPSDPTDYPSEPPMDTVKVLAPIILYLLG
ncbi:MAG: hypothetical protein U9O64_05460 [Campylobacterota bacterium]|nr:hypothetical protein [Campylobacterota bacterium]